MFFLLFYLISVPIIFLTACAIFATGTDEDRYFAQWMGRLSPVWPLVAVGIVGVLLVLLADTAFRVLFEKVERPDDSCSGLGY